MDSKEQMRNPPFQTPDPVKLKEAEEKEPMLEKYSHPRESEVLGEEVNNNDSDYFNDGEARALSGSQIITANISAG